MVRDALQLQGLWSTPLAIQRANEMFLRYGDPDTIFEGRALWTGSRVTPFESLEVQDRTDERSNTPYPHLHLVFVTLPIRIPTNRVAGLSTITPGVTYDAMAMQCRAGGESLSECVAVLSVIKNYVEGTKSPEDARRCLLLYLEEARREVTMAENAVRRNQSYQFYATPKSDRTIAAL